MARSQAKRVRQLVMMEHRAVATALVGADVFTNVISVSASQAMTMERTVSKRTARMAPTETTVAKESLASVHAIGQTRTATVNR